MSSAVIESTMGSNLRGMRKTMRLRQWTKNTAVFAALIFDGKLLDAGLLLQTALAMLCFCLASSSVYLLNDLVDIEKDRQHPTKRLRPLPAGELNPRLGAGCVRFSGRGEHRRRALYRHSSWPDRRRLSFSERWV